MNKPTPEELKQALDDYQRHLNQFQNQLFELEEEINQAKAKQISQKLKDSKIKAT